MFTDFKFQAGFSHLEAGCVFIRCLCSLSNIYIRRSSFNGLLESLKSALNLQVTMSMMVELILSNRSQLTTRLLWWNWITGGIWFLLLTLYSVAIASFMFVFRSKMGDAPDDIHRLWQSHSHSLRSCQYMFSAFNIADVHLWPSFHPCDVFQRITPR